MNTPVSFYNEPTHRAIELLRPAVPVQPVAAAGSQASELAALPLRPAPGVGEAERRALLATSPAFQRALESAAHHSPLGRDPRSLRRLYQTARRRGLHAAFKDAFWRDEAPEGGAELLARASRGRPDLSEKEVIDDLVRLAYAKSADPVRRYVFLLEAEHLARQRNSRDEVGIRLAQAAEQVWDTHRPRIEEAFFDKALPLVREAEQGPAWDEFRSIYFDWVVRAGKIDDVFAALLTQFGPERLATGVQQLRDALVADLRSATVCADVERMRQQQMDLESNRLMWSLLNDGKAFLTDKRTGMGPPPDKVAQLCQEVLGYAAGAATERKLTAICKLVSDDVNGATRTRVAEFMRKLPLGIWSSHDVRHSLLPSLFATPPR